MKRIIIIVIAALLACPALLSAQTKKHVSTRFQGFEREYFIALPDKPAEGKPLVFCLHGHGGHAEGYRPELEAVCMERGFAICYPQGLKSPIGKPSWNVRYPSQEGMQTDDIAFMVHLAKTLPAEYGLNPENVFFSGMSNGGEMCYIMALTHPDVFRAIASMAGLQMGWTVNELTPCGHVPFMEVHGTGDKTSRWEGDPDNNYGWGAYLAVPAAVANIVSMNKCVRYEKTELPLKSEDAHQVILHRYDRGADDSEVLFYEVVGGTHSWALGDLDSCGEILNFFERHCVHQ